jgi:asparagine synthase (glutamine-hydrolysing)
MCGIAGYVGGERSRERSLADLRRMCDAITHRGPDDAGYHVSPGVALGMRRLSIIDLAGGHQPIGNEDSSVQIVFNGEIYNYRELRANLLRSGHQFQTHSDTETIVHLYEEVGDRVVDHLRGMFGFAIWDERRERLLVARDRLGIKPIYYCEIDGGVAFASELKSLRVLEDVPLEIDPSAIADFLSLGYIADPGCIYRGVRKLPPGHTLTWDRTEGIRVSSYWSPFHPEDETLDERSAAEEIRRLLTDAVRYRLIADVPLGAFLSGGIDSSAVVAEMSRQMDRPVKTFSIGFDEPDFNEAPHAARVAAALGTEHTELIVRPDVEVLFDRLVEAFDEPFADSSAIPTFLVSQLARKDVAVALSGDGGDELFGGYTRYADLLGRSASLAAPIQRVLHSASRQLPHSTRGRNRLLEMTRGTRGRYAGMVAHPLAPADGGVARKEVIDAGHSLDNLLNRWFDTVPKRDLLSQASFVDILSYLPGDILTKVDRMSMAVSLEARVPLLDHHLVEFATRIPARLKFRDGKGKWIFREAIRDLVPAEVLQKPKQGFGVPLSHWFRGPLRHRIDELLNTSSSIYEFAEPVAVRRVVTEHLRARRDHSPMLWKLLVLQAWLSAGRSRGAGSSPMEVEDSLTSGLAR